MIMFKRRVARLCTFSPHKPNEYQTTIRSEGVPSVMAFLFHKLIFVCRMVSERTPAFLKRSDDCNCYSF